jgi:hypothetical protein
MRYAQMEMISLPVISTSHLTQEVAETLTALGNDNCWVPCAAWPHGFFISLKSIEENVAEGEEVPKCLQDIAEWLKTKTLPCSANGQTWNGTWVQLDQAVDAVEGLPTYDW